MYTRTVTHIVVMTSCDDHFTIRERACGMTLGATLTLTLKSFQGHAAICTNVPHLKRPPTKHDVDADEKKLSLQQGTVRSCATLVVHLKAATILVLVLVCGTSTTSPPGGMAQ